KSLTRNPPGRTRAVFQWEAADGIGHTIGPAGGASLDLAGACRDGEVGNESVLSLARTVRDDRLIAVGPRHFDRLERLSECADLIELDENRIGDVRLDSPRQTLCVRDEQIVADELHAITKSRGDLCPAVPIVFGESVFDRHNRVVLEPFAI